ncbi:MAG: PA14 domain-containing protein [Chloroflexota bacterium]
MALTDRAEAATTKSGASVRSAVDRFARGLWSARGFFGGLAAIGLALISQQTLLVGKDPASALLYYLAAIVLLILSLLHPVLPARHARSAQEALPAADEMQPLTDSTGIVASRWQKWAVVRTRLGRRVTIPGVALTLVLTGLSALLLAGNPGDPPGGWLWAVALVVLVLTLLGVESWPRCEGLLPGPRSDFFARGVPQLPRYIEIGLVTFILLVAAGLRLYNLEYMPGIFGDEGERGVDAVHIAAGGRDNLFGYGWWGVPNLYFYLVSFMLRLFGTNMVGDRMLSVVSGLLAVLFVFRIGRLLWGSRAGLLAAAMLAVSPLALQFSRLAGESTPTGTLWAIGFFYFFMALRYRRWSDWSLAGIAWGFSLYFYASGKLIIPVIALAGLYCLVRWRVDFFKRYALGFLLLCFAFLLTFMPYAIFSLHDNWQGFTGRAQETSIFSPQNQAQAFGAYGIAYDTTLAGKPLVSNLLSQPFPWTLLVLNQVRATTEVIYRSGDPTPFYQIHEHGGSMLAPLWAALALLGLAYAAWKSWDARFGLLNLWFWGGMLGVALTMDTPSVQRLAGAWPAIMLFPALLLDRVFAAAWPLSLNVARRWASVPLVCLLLFFGFDSYREYFVHYPSLCPYCDSTTQARYVQSLGQQYKGYELGVGDSLVQFSYGSTRFVAGEVEGVDLSVPADSLPITDNGGKGAAFIVYPENYAYLPLIRLFYPGGTEEEVKGSDGSVRFVSYKLAAQQLAAFQGLNATYTGREGGSITRHEANLGTGMANNDQGNSWAAPADLTYPAAATWEGGLIAPSYGLYTFSLRGTGDARLTIDGQVRLEESSTTQPSPEKQTRIELVLAKGMHDVRLSGTLLNRDSSVEVGWAPGRSQTRLVEAKYLYDGHKGTTGGLSGEVGPQSDPQAIYIPNPFDGQPAAARRSDPFFGFQEATTSLGREPFIARWRGTLAAPVAGEYAFETTSNGPSVLMIDGKTIVDNKASTGGSVGSASGSVTLAAGEHQLELRYAWQSGPARLLLYWTPPRGQRVLVPPTALVPAARSWTAQEQAGAPGAQAAPPAPLPGKAAVPVAVIGSGAGLSNPRGVAVDGKGNIYVGDRGNHRVVVFSPDGKVLRTWGKAPDAGTVENPQPGDFVDIADLAISPDGHLYVMDYEAHRLQIFNTTGHVLQVVDKSVLKTCAANGIDGSLQGSVYMACTSTSVVDRLSLAADGTPPNVAASLAGDEGDRLEQPVDVAVDPSGRVYAIDLKDRLVRFGPQGNITEQWTVPVGQLEGGSRLALSPDGSKMYVSDSDRKRVDVINLAEGTIGYFGSPGSDSGQFQGPSGIAVGPDGRVYVLDRVNNNVQVFNLEK